MGGPVFPNDDDRRAPFEVAAGSVEPLAPPWRFEDLLVPVLPAEFCSDYWARAPLLVRRGRPNFYRDLIHLDEIDRRLAMDELFARHSVTLAKHEYGPPVEPPSTLSELYERFAAGDSIRMRRLECLLEPTAPAVVLLRQMERALQHPRRSLSCYVTPPGAGGLGAHQDETEIFTLQILGKKRWRVYHRVRSDRSAMFDPTTLGLPSHDFEIEPGDLLYLPSGFVHEVTSEVISFSLTIVFAPFTWRCILDRLVSSLAAEPEFYEPLPAGILNAAGAAMIESAFQACVDRVRDELAGLRAWDVLDGLALSLVAGQTLPAKPHFEALAMLNEIVALESWVRRRGDVSAHLGRCGESVVLTLPGGHTIQASGRAYPAFDQVTRAARALQVKDVAGGLTDEAKLALVRKLVSVGFLELTTEPSEPDAGDPASRAAP